MGSPQKGKVLYESLCDGTQKSTLKGLHVMSFPDFTPNLENPYLDSTTALSRLHRAMESQTDLGWEGP